MDLHNLSSLLKDEARCVLVVAEPHFWKTNDDFFFVPNGEILKQMAEKSGMRVEFDLLVPLAKAYKRHRIINGERLIILRKGPISEIRLSVKPVNRFQKVDDPPALNWKSSLQVDPADCNP